MASITRRCSLATLPLLLGACGETQPAEPLGRTIPLAIAVVGSIAATWIGLHRLIGRRRRSPLDRAARVARLAVLTPAVTAFGVLGAIALWVIGFSFAEAHVDVFTYDETVAMCAIALGAMAVLGAVTSVLAAGVSSPSPRVHATATAVLWLVVVLGTVAATGAGLVWLPAAVLSTRLRPTSAAPARPVSGPWTPAHGR